MTFGEPGLDDLLEVVYFGFSADPSLDDYYKTTGSLTPFLRSDSWRTATTGFYVNSDGFSFRLSYFTSDSSSAATLLEEQRERGRFREPRESRSHPHVRFENDYGGSELPFRRYLCSYSSIGLDLLESDPTHSKRLFATFRGQVLPAGGDPRSHFESSFIRLSPAYQSLSPDERDAFWDAFAFFQPGCTRWAHMFVNMILGFDCAVQSALSLDEINAGLRARDVGFDVPGDWHSQ